LNKSNNIEATSIFHQLSEKSSFFNSELLNCSKEKINSFLESKELEDYKFYLEKIVRVKGKTLKIKKR
jgi:oligoendopeptidase F